MKSKVLIILSAVIFAFIFSLLAFTYVVSITTSWILAYIFILLDMVLLTVVTLTGTPAHAYLRLVPNLIAYSGIVVSFFTNLGFMVFLPNNVVAVIIVNVVIIGLTAGPYLFMSSHNASAVTEEKMIKEKQAVILRDKEKLHDSMNLLTDFYLKKEVERAYDAVSNAVIDGHRDTVTLEDTIDRNCDRMLQACERSDVAEIKKLSQQIILDVQKRETMIKSKEK